MGLGMVIKELVAEKNITIKQLSEKTGISINTLYSITKRDSNNIRLDNLERIADVLGIPLQDLLKRMAQEIEEEEKELKYTKYQIKEKQKRTILELEKAHQEIYDMANSITEYRNALVDKGIVLTNDKYSWIHQQLLILQGMHTEINSLINKFKSDFENNSLT